MGASASNYATNAANTDVITETNQSHELKNANIRSVVDYSDELKAAIEKIRKDRNIVVTIQDNVMVLDYENGSANEVNDFTGNVILILGCRIGYEGIFSNSRMNGPGICYFLNGQVEYDGHFKNDRRDGPGIVYNIYGGIEHEGEWKNNEFVYPIET
jgi:hypothetical protein